MSQMHQVRPSPSTIKTVSSHSSLKKLNTQSQINSNSANTNSGINPNTSSHANSNSFNTSKSENANSHSKKITFSNPSLTNATNTNNQYQANAKDSSKLANSKSSEG
jgi:hypothetical protein